MAKLLVLRDGENVSGDVLQRILGSFYSSLPVVAGVGTGFSTGSVGSKPTAITGHLAVTANGVNLQLTILPGWASVIRDLGGSTFDPRALFAESSANDTSVTLTANASGTSRTDTVCLKIDMNTAPDSTGTNVVSFVALAGGASNALANAPADGNLYLPLANVVVANAAANVSNANVTDLRQEYSVASVKTTGASGLASPRSIRSVSAWTTVGAPTGIAAQVGDYGLDGNSNLWVCTVAGTPGTWKPRGAHVIDVQTPSGVNTFDFTGAVLPPGYTNLEIWFYGARSDVAALSATLQMRFNNDATANYDAQEIHGSGATATSSEALGATFGQVGDVPGNTATANYTGSGVIRIPGYSATVGLKVATSNEAHWSSNLTGVGVSIQRAFKWRTVNTALTRITMLLGGGNFVAGSTFMLIATGPF